MIFDMETGDPDDAWTLAWLLGRSDVQLLVVTITPGSPYQVGFVRAMLKRFGREDVRVGAALVPGKPGNLSGGCRKVLKLDHVEPSSEAEPPAKLIAELAGEDVTFLGGGPMKNLAHALRTEKFILGTLVQQGGFVGSPIVPEADQLLKFKGLGYCPTWNLGGAPVAAEEVLASPAVLSRRFVGKNICHGCLADEDLILAMASAARSSMALHMIWTSVPLGKALHDLLAATAAVDPGVVESAPVRLHRNPKGHWGSVLGTSQQPANCHAAVRYDHQRFSDTLLGV